MLEPNKNPSAWYILVWIPIAVVKPDTLFFLTIELVYDFEQLEQP